MQNSRFRQTSIRALLIVTTIAALAMAIWLNRSNEADGEIRIEVGRNGQVQLGGVSTANQNLLKMLDKKSRLYQKWESNEAVTITATGNTPNVTIQELLKTLRSEGFGDISLGLIETSED